MVRLKMLWKYWAGYRYAQRLPRQLATGWGASATYTADQIGAAVKKLRLDPDFIVFGYAAFLPEEQFKALVARMPIRLPYDRARAIFERFSLPARMGDFPSYVTPAPERNFFSEIWPSGRGGG